MKKIGTRNEVINNKALMTGGKLTKSDLKYNKYGKIVSINKAIKHYYYIKKVVVIIQKVIQIVIQ